MLEEELFCVKFELDMLSEVCLKNEAERWVPGFIHANTEQDHLDRYMFACNFSYGKRVLDIACGIGKGSNILAEIGKAKSVTGVDICSKTIRYAKHRYHAPEITYLVCNAENYNKENYYEFIVCFETIEHLKGYENLLLNLSKSLIKGGRLIISTPISSVDKDLSPANPYHVQEWGYFEFQKLVSNFLIIEKVFLQLYPVSIPARVWQRIKRRLGRLIGGTTYQKTSEFVAPRSYIIEYNGQFSCSELGNGRYGNQVLICRK